ncbi:hypothetical protein IC620_15165 [Hazenella sp. IB182357]|uniref:Uncharacterized protein n=1 Tax=Polycladospora coralii TaxID=2771432 RepID=A0A926NE13_9BACL|nr:hypothetical protein [Polycladospora coralii]MBD1373685.1 hypothetical protein [Polycladospora coralii]
MKKLKAYLFGNKVKLPEVVQKRVEAYKQDREWSDHLFCKIIVNNTAYFFIQYDGVKRPPHRARLVIRSDGSIPPIEEVCQENYQDVVWMGTNIDHCCYRLSTIGKKWSKSPVWPYKRMKQLLKNIRDSSDKMPAEMKIAWESFYQVTEIYLVKQDLIKKCYTKGMELYEKLLATHQASLKELDALEHYHDTMGRAAYRQNDIQLKTYEERKKLLRYLVKHTKWYQLVMWITIIELAYHHTKLLNEKKLSTSDREINEKIHDRMMNDELRLVESDFYQKERGILRNPSQTELVNE